MGSGEKVSLVGPIRQPQVASKRRSKTQRIEKISQEYYNNGYLGTVKNMPYKRMIIIAIKTYRSKRRKNEKCYISADLRRLTIVPCQFVLLCSFFVKLTQEKERNITCINEISDSLLAPIVELFVY